ncbi:MAG: hypothetical protein FJY10_10235 [Bacteroidetes bacterium]|nr:hypothetical protein [Bacteroidota bacterium]
MKQFKLISTLLFFFLYLNIFGQDKTVTYLSDHGWIPEEHLVDLTHIDANVQFKPEFNQVVADVTFDFIVLRSATDSLVFSAPGFKISGIGIDDQSCSWHYQGSNLVIIPPVALKKGDSAKIHFSYTAAPETGTIYFIGWRPEEAGKRKQIWAHRPNGWLPYADDLLTVDMKVTFDSSYKVFSNGERIAVTDNPDQTRTWHYRMSHPHPFFSTALVIGDYDYKTSYSRGGVPLELWYYPDREEAFSTTYKYSDKMMDFFEKEMGVVYPWPLYRQAPLIDYMYGGMETTTATVFGDFMQIDPRAYWQRNFINVNAHELAHQWFGNYLSHMSHADVWLTESFGTYYAKLFEKYNFGYDHYQNMRYEEMNLVFEAAEKNDYPVGGTRGGVARIYQKGSLVLDMLRDILGEEDFRAAIKYYLKKNPYAKVETGDLLNAIYLTGGRRLDWFIDQWIRRGGEPELVVSWKADDKKTSNRMINIQVNRVHDTSNLVGLFRFPVDIEIHYRDGRIDRRKVWIEKPAETIVIPYTGDTEIAFVLFDPGRKILKKIHFEKDIRELMFQAQDAPDLLDRFDALQALRNSPLLDKRDFLVRCFSKETHHLTKGEIIFQLAGDTSQRTLDLFRTALRDSDANIRKAVLVNIKQIPKPLKESFEAGLTDISYLNVELSLDLLYRNFPQDIGKYLEFTKNEMGWRGLNIRMKWLEIAIPLGYREYLKELVEYSSPRYEFETRMNALTVMQKLNYLTEEGIPYLFSACTHWNNKLYMAARPVLKYFLTQDKYRDKIRSAYTKGKWTEREQKILEGTIDK